MRKPFERPRIFEVLHAFWGMEVRGAILVRSWKVFNQKRKCWKPSKQNNKSLATSELIIWESVGCRNAKAFTLPETNIAPKNDGFQQESPFPGVYFRVPC